MLTNVTPIKIKTKWKSQRISIQSKNPSIYISMYLSLCEDPFQGWVVCWSECLQPVTFQRWKVKVRKNKKSQLLYILQWISSDNKERLVGRHKLLSWCSLNKIKKCCCQFGNLFLQCFVFFLISFLRSFDPFNMWCFPRKYIIYNES